MRLLPFLHELRRRNVIRVGLAYGVAAVVVAEVADIFLPALNLPSWSVTLVVAVLLLGFPVALMLAWALEITPEGVVRDGQVSGAGPGERADAPPAVDGRPSGAATSGRDPEPSIAVLAFTDMSAAGDQEYLGDGIAEEIIDALTKLGPPLQVAARTSSFRYKVADTDVREIGRELGVAAVLAGSVRKAGARLRISAQLVSVDTGYHLWSERYDRELDDVFEIQDQIARAVTDSLRIELLGADTRPLVRSTTTDADAYDAYLKGRHAWRRRYRLGLDAALQHFRCATERDPEFAEPYAGISDTFSVMAIYTFGADEASRTEASVALDRALAGGKDLADVQFAAGFHQLVFGCDAPRAIEHFRAAIHLGGRHPRSRGWLGLALIARGQGGAGLSECRGATEEAPESTYLAAVHAIALAGVGAFDDARAACDLVLAQDPTDMLARYTLGIVDSFTDQHDSAVTRLSYVYQHGQAPAFGVFLAGALARSGRPEEAARTLDEVEARFGRPLSGTAGPPLFHAWAGDLDAAFASLDDAVAARAPGLITALVLPPYIAMRADPRWAVLRPFLLGA